MNPLQRLRDILLEREIRSTRQALSRALDLKQYRLAGLLFDDLRAAVGRRSPEQVARMERRRGLRKETRA